MFVLLFRSLNIFPTIPQNTSVQSTALEKINTRVESWSFAVEEAYGIDLMGCWKDGERE